MATNLIAQMINEFRGDTLDSVASALGESPARTQSAIGGVLPALFGGLANKASTPDQANGLLDIMKRNRLDSGPMTDVASAIKAPGGLNTLMNTGRPLMESLFGGRAGGIADWVSSSSGVSRASSSSLLSLALPLVLGQIGKRVSGAGWNASSLMNLLSGQRSFLQDVPGLSGVLGGTHDVDAEPAARHVGAYETETRRHAPTIGAYDAAPPTRHHRGWLWALPLLLLIPLLFFALSRRNPPREVAVQRTAPPAEVRQPAPAPTPAPTTPAPQPTEPQPIGTSSEPATPTNALGALVDRRLPNNTVLKVPENGVESRLIQYLESPGQLDTNTWFSFDRLSFETNSARLTPGANEQVRNIAEILKAYPQAKVALGGYTDNTGDSARNLALSQQRATATMNQIARYGVDRSRLRAEGFGDQNPIADNSTPDGRQRNRRVDIRVTDK